MRDMKTRIVVAGGGVAGVYAAMYLDKTLARRRDVEVVLNPSPGEVQCSPSISVCPGGEHQRI